MFKPTVHEYSEPFRGDIASAFGLARTALVSQGFEILADTGSELRAQGPWMRSTHQAAIVGASDLLLRVDGSMIAATATLGGVARMRAFVVLFPPALILSLMLMPLFQGNPVPWVHAGLMIAPWLLISPWMANSMERRTRRAVDAIVRGMIQVGSRS